MAKLYGSLEAGGTKFVCAVGDEKFQVVEKTQFPTTTPYEQLIVRLNFSNVMKTNWLESLLVHSVQLMLIQTLKHMVL